MRNEEARDKGARVAAGRDNGSSVLHYMRFVPLPASSDEVLVQEARKVVPVTGWPPVGDYDFTSVGVEFVSPKAFYTAANPNSTKLSVKLFAQKNSAAFARENARVTISSCSSFEISEALLELESFAELKESMFAMLVTILHVRPWDRSILILYHHLLMKNFYMNLGISVQLVSQFIDFVIANNKRRWSNKQPPIPFTELEYTASRFFNRRLPLAAAFQIQRQALQDLSPLVTEAQQVQDLAAPRGLDRNQRFQPRQFDGFKPQDGSRPVETPKQYKPYNYFQQGQPRKSYSNNPRAGTTNAEPCMNYNSNKCEYMGDASCRHRTRNGNIIIRPHTCTVQTSSGKCGGRHPAFLHR